jgi:hypothetical protein
MTKSDHDRNQKDWENGEAESKNHCEWHGRPLVTHLCAHRASLFEVSCPLLFGSSGAHV